MCGICGVIGKSDETAVSAMVDAMHHRGPDDSGLFTGDSIALGMSRLAILDTSQKGHQPMSNEDGSLWIVYNGETYNFKEEREELIQKGHVFNSTSDTEVILRMYEVYGDDFLLRMRGMFALAIYDKRGGKGRERILLARDHLGIKPLLYAKIGGAYVFASEIKAILASGLIEREIEPEALRLLLTTGSIAQPTTAIKGVKMLLPGHRLIIESGRERTERFWKLKTDRFPELRDSSYEEQVETVREVLEKSVRLQMVSDVPIGAFLSGGVDSSLLVALMSKVGGSDRVKTFSIGFQEEGAHIDETDKAQRIAEFVGTDHSRVEITGKDVRDKISHIARSLDQPSVDGVNSYFVSLAAKRAVTVAISGTGGDELFAGYPWFLEMLEAVGRDDRQPLRAGARGIFSSVARQPIFDGVSLGRFGNLLERARGASGFIPRYGKTFRIFDVTAATRLVAGPLREPSGVGRPYACDLMGADELPDADPIERVSALCLRGYTQNQLLRDIDAVSMAHSLEVRVPFLDHVLTDIALSLPINAKLSSIDGLSSPATASYHESGVKKILLDIGRDLLPEGIGVQQKMGFVMPFNAWLKGPLRDVLEDTFSASSIRARGLFDEKETLAIKKQFLDGRLEWARPWLVMMTELWCREVLGNG